MAQQTIVQSKEVRFAVVMYGGVSLAIYINGVTQEIYNLVRATATRELADGSLAYLFPDEDLKGASKVYRELGEKLNTRFVVDILSGTSAGGINAVFLAKSLANGESFEQLRDLWIKEGDIGILINDRQSEQGLDGLKVPKDPTSLLNSQRMLFKLLYAIDTMKPDTPSSGGTQGGKSPYVDELDLFVTATDIRGLVESIKLADGTVEEYRFKNVFHFRYATANAAGGEDANDFIHHNSPFLAFAARCTSSFPFAFEPMRLDDVKPVLDTQTFRGKYPYDPLSWQKFYRDYLRPGEDFTTRSFGDGGYLDNKPFSYVTETLLRRRADLPVDRKLLYIEPAPEHPTEKDINVRPDAIKNVEAALLTLPRYETIHEDLKRVKDRNAMIERVGAILQRIQYASYTVLTKGVEHWQLDGPTWAKLYLDDKVLDWYGPSYAAYHQLRVASVLDDLASGYVRAMGWDESSEQAKTFRRQTLEGWRQAYYRTDPNIKDDRKSENDLLFRLDASWRIRRMQFMQALIDGLLAGLLDATPGMGMEAYHEVQNHAREIVRYSLEGKQDELAKWPFGGSAKSRSDYCAALLWIKSRFNDAYRDLRAEGRQIRSRNLLASIEKGKDGPNMQAYGQHLQALKDAFESGADNKTVYACLETLSIALASPDAKPEIKGAVRAMLSENSAACKVALGVKSTTTEKMPPSSGSKAALAAVQACLQFYYNRYEYYDMLTFPLYYGTEVGESDVVEIIRISPENAPSLRPGSQKLAGTKLSDFGAFFVREWRENDMLWGRLDGAECLINALLPGDANTEMRTAFVEAAHQAILKETFLSVDQKKLFEALQSKGTGNVDKVKETMERALGGGSGVLENFKRDYKVDPDFPPDTTLGVSARATRVTGKLLAGISDKYPALASPAGTISRVGQIFTGLVQVALPQSLPNLLFNHWIWLLYLLELFLALGGRPLGLPDVARLGSMAFGITVVAHLAVLYLQAVLKKYIPALRIVRWIIVLLVILGAAALIFLVYVGLVYLRFLQPPAGVFGNLINTLQMMAR